MAKSLQSHGQAGLVRRFGGISAKAGRERTVRIRVEGYTQGCEEKWNSEIVEKLGDVLSDLEYCSTTRRTSGRLHIAELVEWAAVDRVLGFHAGRDPNPYVKHGHRPAGYIPLDYSDLRDSASSVAAVAKIPGQNDLRTWTSLSDSFRSALWATEHMLKMGFTNLFGGNIYVGGVIDPYI
ncbi:hypothetical protein B0H21DRAFT_713995, partial [Amylocystis lapponica]